MFDSGDQVCLKLYDIAMKISEINSMTNSSYLVVLFCATAGKNGEDLGVDEEQVVLFVYLLYDVPNNKVRTSDHVINLQLKPST